MTLRTTSARVLRTYPLGETSFIAVLLCEDDQLLRVVAKGARTPRSPFRGLLEPGTPLQVVIYLKPKGGLHLLKEATLAGRLSRPTMKLEALSLRTAGLELVMQGNDGQEVPEGLYQLLESYLGVFEQEQPDFTAPFFAFEASLLDLHGLLPGLDLCCVTGRPLVSGGIRFLPGEGLFADQDCGSEGIDLECDEEEWVKSVFSKEPAELETRVIPRAARKKVGRILHMLLSRYLPGYRLPRSLELLRRLRGDRNEIHKESQG